MASIEYRLSSSLDEGLSDDQIDINIQEGAQSGGIALSRRLKMLSEMHRSERKDANFRTEHIIYSIRFSKF